MPKDRLAALRATYAAVMEDPKFVQGAEKTVWTSASRPKHEVEALVDKMMQHGEAVLDRRSANPQVEVSTDLANDEEKNQQIAISVRPQPALCHSAPL